MVVVVVLVVVVEDEEKGVTVCDQTLKRVTGYQ